jgi:hypothetical protein
MTKFLDLDAIAVDDNPLTVKLGGVKHVLKPITVKDFIANTKALQNLSGTNISVEAEMNLMMDMIMRAFPTVTRDMLEDLKLDSLNQLVEFANSNNGQKKVEDEIAKENPQPAG